MDAKVAMIEDLHRKGMAMSHRWSFADVHYITAARDQESDKQMSKRLTNTLRVADDAAARGDFRYPWEMTSRTEARELLTTIGVPAGRIYSQEEAEELSEEERQKAQSEGRIIQNPRKGVVHKFYFE